MATAPTTQAYRASAEAGQNGASVSHTSASTPNGADPEQSRELPLASLSMDPPAAGRRLGATLPPGMWTTFTVIRHLLAVTFLPHTGWGAGLVCEVSALVTRRSGSRSSTFADFAGLCRVSPLWTTSSTGRESAFRYGHVLEGTTLIREPPGPRPHSESVCSWVQFPPPRSYSGTVSR